MFVHLVKRLAAYVEFKWGDYETSSSNLCSSIDCSLVQIFLPKAHINMHTTLFQTSRNRLTLLSRHSVRTQQENELKRNSSGTFVHSVRFYF